MRPEVVSQLLSKVEKSWVQGHVMTLRNITDEASSYSTMETSCLKISSAIVAGSEGEKDRVVEYMKDVCGSASTEDAPPSSMCMEFAAGVEGAMTDDESFNRDNLDLKPFCKKFWGHTIAVAAQAEKQKLDAEEAKKEEEEKKREEEAEAEKKKLQEDEAKQAAEEAAKKAKEEAAQKSKEAEEAQALKVVEQNTTQTQQSQNATLAETKTDVESAVEAPQTNATSAVAVESASAPSNTSEPLVTTAAEEVKNATATQSESAPDKQKTATDVNVSASNVTSK